MLPLMIAYYFVVGKFNIWDFDLWSSVHKTPCTSGLSKQCLLVCTSEQCSFG